MLRPHARHALVVVFASALPVGAVVGCSGDDDTSATVATAVASTGPSSDLTSPASTAPAASDAPATTSADTSPDTSPTTLPPPPDLDELAAALLGSRDVGVPETWAIRDLDPAIMDDALTLDADPFQGFLSCDDATLRPQQGWIQRTFTAPERPLDNGLLRIDLIVAVQDAASFDENLGGLGSCTTSSGDAALQSSEVEIAPLAESGATVSGIVLDGGEIQLSAGPSSEVPYPSAYTAVTTNADGRTVTAVVSGIDTGVPLSDATRRLVGQLLARL